MVSLCSHDLHLNGTNETNAERIQKLAILPAALVGDARVRQMMNDLPAYCIPCEGGMATRPGRPVSELAAASWWAVQELGVNELLICGSSYGHSTSWDANQFPPTAKSTSAADVIRPRSSILERTEAAQRQLETAKNGLIVAFAQWQEWIARHGAARGTPDIQLRALFYVQENGLFLEYHPHASVFSPCVFTSAASDERTRSWFPSEWSLASL